MSIFDRIMRNFYDFSIWMMLVAIKKTLRVFPSLIHNRICDDKIIRSKSTWKPPIPLKGSLYHMLDDLIKRQLTKKDWIFVRDGITNKYLRASEAYDLHLKFAAVLAKNGFNKGDCLHMIMSNTVYYHSILLAVWRLGGIISCGDPGLKAETLKFQVRCPTFSMALTLSGSGCCFSKSWTS